MQGGSTDVVEQADRMWCGIRLTSTAPPGQYGWGGVTRWTSSGSYSHEPVLSSRGVPSGAAQLAGSSPARGPSRWTCPKTTHSASMPSRWTTRASAGMLAWRICRPSTTEVKGARRRWSRFRVSTGIVEARSNSATSLEQMRQRFREPPRGPRAATDAGAARSRSAARRRTAGGRTGRAGSRPRSPASDAGRGSDRGSPTRRRRATPPDSETRTRAGASVATTRSSIGVASAGTSVAGSSRSPRRRTQGRTSGASWLPGTSTTSRSAAEAGADRAQDRVGDLQRGGGASLHQLDDVAEQHEAVDVVERVEQPFERLGATEDVVFEPAAEMEVRDDEGPHAPPRYP